MTIKEIKQKFPFLFYKAEKVEASAVMPGYGFNPANSHMVVIHTDKGPTVVNHCSKGYNVIQNSTMIESFLNALQGEFEHITMDAYYRKGFGRFFINFHVEDHALKLTPLDSLTPRIRLVNSYDGGLKYNSLVGVYRLICSNGLTVPVEHDADTFMHTPASGIAVEKTLTSLRKFIPQFKSIVEPYKELIKQSVPALENRIEEVAKELRFPTRQVEAVLARAQEEMKLLKSKPNDWIIYNAFNYQLNHNDDIGMKDNRKEDLDKAILTYLLEAA